jgi:dGTPase
MFELAGKLRSDAITTLLREAAQVFEREQGAILAGEFDRPLMAVIPQSASFDGLTKVAKERYYRAPDVLRMEITGAVAIQGVLSTLVEAAFDGDSVRSANLRRLMPWLATDEPAYDRLLAITDQVSGMTDGYVLRQYRELSGDRLPGGRG